MTALQEIQIISALVLGVLGFGLGVYNTWVQRREKVPRVKVSLEVGSTYAIPLVNPMPVNEASSRQGTT